MGGFGSGRPCGSGRAKVEGCRSLDVNRLPREGCVRSGWSGIWQWTRDGERVAWINLRAEFDRLHLTYRVRIGGGDWEDIDESVRVVRVADEALLPYVARLLARTNNLKGNNRKGKRSYWK